MGSPLRGKMAISSDHIEAFYSQERRARLGEISQEKRKSAHSEKKKAEIRGENDTVFENSII